MIERNECDLVVGPIVPTFRRFAVAQPLPQYMFVRVTPCGGTQQLYKTDVFAYVTALDPQGSSRPEYQRLWRQVVQYDGLRTAAEMVTKPIFDIVLEGKAVFFCDDTMLYMTIARLYPNGFEGEFYMGTDYFINNPFAMFARRSLDPNIITQIHNRLRWMWEAGLPQEWKRKAMASARSLSATAQTAFTAENMKLTDIGAIFYLLLLGQGCACVAFAAELSVGQALP
ncbi:hypothetical protein HPB48_018983 [Haemaphysalis longicornis]|uniref:Uncharacterized protein n=1 Tax=Haemaphysalis longicornis TaxID=44386 RepID=A0A9J6FXB7_HAELO|nr:hypothetical protein HPB48_018983 [Haemaphysalis longicornis]